MKANEVMHHYIGAKVKVERMLISVFADKVCTLLGVMPESCEIDNGSSITRLGRYSCRLQLRKESDMTEEEKKEYKALCEVYTEYDNYHMDYIEITEDTLQSIAYLFKIGIDRPKEKGGFGLIKAGEADYNPEIYK